MNTSIAALKRSKSNLDTLIGELNKVAEPQKQTNSYQDDRFWKPELDKSGNGYAVFRFLPADYVRLFQARIKIQKNPKYLGNINVPRKLILF